LPQWRNKLGKKQVQTFLHVLSVRVVGQELLMRHADRERKRFQVAQQYIHVNMLKLALLPLLLPASLATGLHAPVRSCPKLPPSGDMAQTGKSEGERGEPCTAKFLMRWMHPVACASTRCSGRTNFFFCFRRPRRRRLIFCWYFCACVCTCLMERVPMKAAMERHGPVGNIFMAWRNCSCSCSDQRPRVIGVAGAPGATTRLPAAP
jgi:hypothetical protein